MPKQDDKFENSKTESGVATTVTEEAPPVHAGKKVKEVEVGRNTVKIKQKGPTKEKEQRKGVSGQKDAGLDKRKVVGIYDIDKLKDRERDKFTRKLPESEFFVEPEDLRSGDVGAVPGVESDSKSGKTIGGEDKSGGKVRMQGRGLVHRPVEEENILEQEKDQATLPSGSEGSAIPSSHAQDVLRRAGTKMPEGEKGEREDIIEEGKSGDSDKNGVNGDENRPESDKPSQGPSDSSGMPESSEPRADIDKQSEPGLGTESPDYQNNINSGDARSRAENQEILQSRRGGYSGGQEREAGAIGGSKTGGAEKSGGSKMREIWAKRGEHMNKMREGTKKGLEGGRKAAKQGAEITKKGAQGAVKAGRAVASAGSKLLPLLANPYFWVAAGVLAIVFLLIFGGAYLCNCAWIPGFVTEWTTGIDCSQVPKMDSDGGGSAPSAPNSYLTNRGNQSCTEEAEKETADMLARMPGFDVNHASCSATCPLTCNTSLAGLKDDTVNGALYLKNHLCNGGGGTWIITGGTETGHTSGGTSHGEGYKLDFGENSNAGNGMDACLDQLFMDPECGQTPFCTISRGGFRYTIDNHAPPHWDVKFEKG